MVNTARGNAAGDKLQLDVEGAREKMVELWTRGT